MKSPYRSPLEEAIFCCREKRILGAVIFLLICLASPRLFAQNPQASRYFISGDGILIIGGESVRYRDANGQEDRAGLQRLHAIFHAPWPTNPEERLDLRFLEILDYVQDQLGGKTYLLRSGYRSPNLNQKLRQKGKLAAQSSMHIEGAAADLQLSGVSSEKVFEFVKNLNCCGIGWYHGAHFHLDAGPPRYWDEKTSKTEEQAPQQNEKVILQADQDRYAAGEVLAAKLMRVTEYPIGVSANALIQTSGEPLEKPSFSKPVALAFSGTASREACRALTSRSEARKLTLALPKDVPAGKYQIKISFCQNERYEKMPTEILSRSFEITPK